MISLSYRTKGGSGYNYTRRNRGGSLTNNKNRQFSNKMGYVEDRSGLVQLSKKHIENSNFSYEEIKKAEQLIRDSWTTFVRNNFDNEPCILDIKLVGSRAKGTNRPDSDADFLVTLDKAPHMNHEYNLRTMSERTVDRTLNPQTVTLKFNEQMLGWNSSGSEVGAGGERINGVPIDAFFRFQDSSGNLTENIWKPKQ